VRIEDDPLVGDNQTAGIVDRDSGIDWLYLVFDGLVGLPEDVGQLADQHDPGRRRLVGSFPQAFTHVALVNPAHNLALPDGPARSRAQECG